MISVYISNLVTLGSSKIDMLTGCIAGRPQGDVCASQQTMTHDFTCSVSELMSSTGSIHVFPYVNSPDSVNKFGVLTHVYREIMSFSPVKPYHF